MNSNQPGSGQPKPKPVHGLGPAIAFAYLNRSMCFAQLGEFAKSHADGKKAVQLGPALILNAFTDAIAKEPSQVIHYQNRAWFHIEMQDWCAALLDCNKAIELDCTQAMTYTQRAAAHMGLRNFDRAVDDYSRAIDLDPLQPWSFFSRAGAHQALGNFEQAAADYTEAIRLERRRTNPSDSNEPPRPPPPRWHNRFNDRN